MPETYQGSEIQLKTWLQVPTGSGPFNTVMLIPGCDGLDRNGFAQMQTWARWLLRLNYAVMMIDSFTPRGVGNACGNGKIVQGEYTQQMPIPPLPIYPASSTSGRQSRRHRIFPRRLGGSRNCVEPQARHRRVRAHLAVRNISIAAVVTVYPACFRHVEASFAVPLLILIGERDDWTRRERASGSLRTPDRMGHLSRSRSIRTRFTSSTSKSRRGHISGISCNMMPKPPRTRGKQSNNSSPSGCTDASRQEIGANAAGLSYHGGINNEC